MVTIFNKILNKIAGFRRQPRQRQGDEEQANSKKGKKHSLFNPVFNKEAVSWYLITLKIKEIVHAKLKKSPSRQEPEWVMSIRRMMVQAHAEEAARPSARLCVYRVPKSLREGNERAAYMPQVVSIGPLHAGQEPLREMERHKWRVLYHVLKRTRHDVTTFLDALRPMEYRVRACYDGCVAEMPSNEFVQCLLLDGIFVLELFHGTEYGYSQQEHNPIFTFRGVMHAVRSDMILLENQVPLFVLELLLRILRHPKQTDSLASLAVRFFDPLIPHRKYRSKLGSTVDVNAAAAAAFDPLIPHRKYRSKLGSTVDVNAAAAAAFDPLIPHRKYRSKLGSTVDVNAAAAAAFDPLSIGLSNPMLHCLDVFRRNLLCAGPKKSSWSPPLVADKRRQQFVHCASELREAGIRCKRRNTDRFWDIKFEKGVLHIPRILIRHSTKALFLNLIAFEQCHLDIDTPEDNKMTAYAIFMDNLINSVEDVKYLHDRGIIEHKLGSNAEVADLFNRLCLEVVLDINHSYLSKLSNDLNEYYDYKWSTWVASLRHSYFTNPWAIISIVAGVFLMLLTMMQTFYSAYSYYRPPA